MPKKQTMYNKKWRDANREAHNTKRRALYQKNKLKKLLLLKQTNIEEFQRSLQKKLIKEIQTLFKIKRII